VLVAMLGTLETGQGGSGSFEWLGLAREGVSSVAWARGIDTGLMTSFGLGLPLGAFNPGAVFADCFTVLAIVYTPKGAGGAKQCDRPL
jgi:hypothetical protein